MSHANRKRLGVRKKIIKTPKRASMKSPDKLIFTEEKDNIPSPNSPPPLPLSLSFESDLNDDIMDFLDRMDCGIISSTPLSTGGSHKSQTKRISQLGSLVHQLDFSTPGKESHVTSHGGQIATPLTSPANTTRNISVLQTPQHKSKLSLAYWGLPDKVLEQYASHGVTDMFHWQAECLSLPGVLSGSNIVYSAPTSAGKTLVAELLMLKCVLEKHKKAMVILPFVSIVHEKATYLQSMFEQVGVKVGGFMGGQSPQGGFAAVDVAICTIEKANSLVNHLLEEGSVGQLGMVVVDELHMVGDHHRGYLLELLLTKLLYVCRKACSGTRTVLDKKGEEELPSISNVQILGMSATLPNVSTLARWLNAVLYQTDFRPVPLCEMVKMGNILYDCNFQVIKELKTSSSSNDEEDIALICHEKIQKSHSILIFCPTKAWCEKLAQTLSEAPFLQTFCENDVQKRVDKSMKLDITALNGVCEQLRRTQVGLDPVLAKTIPVGVAFHHAGLTFDEREIIEEAFRQSLLRILVATSTLSSGVNLPAHLVIIRTPVFHQSALDTLIYKQMVGRAGRKGIEKLGESILICKPSEKQKVTLLLQSAPLPVKSCLGRPHVTRSKGPAPKGSELLALKRAVLEVIANGTALLERDIMNYLSCTLLYSELTETENYSEDISTHTSTLLNDTLKFLTDHDFIRERIQDKPTHTGDPLPLNREYYSTQLGLATVASALSPDDALVVFSEFLKARKAFVLENELHIIYLVTPVYIQDQWPSIDWYRFLCMWERLPGDMRHVANVVGVQESFLARAVQSKPPERTPIQQQKLRLHRRFYTSLALHDLVKEVPISQLSHKYGASKGLMQSLQSASGTFAGMVTVFCSRLGWTNLELLLSQFQSRLTFGIERELVDLVRISLLNGCRARVLYNAGYHTLSALATANPKAIEATLRNAFPFKSKGVTEQDQEEVLVVNWCTKLRKGMTESDGARRIVQETRQILCEEFNIPISTWETCNNNNPINDLLAQQMEKVKHNIIDVQLPQPHTNSTPMTLREDHVRLNRKVNNKPTHTDIASVNKRPELATTESCPPPHPISTSNNTHTVSKSSLQAKVSTRGNNFNQTVDHHNVVVEDIVTKPFSNFVPSSSLLPIENASGYPLKAAKHSNHRGDVVMAIEGSDEDTNNDLLEQPTNQSGDWSMDLFMDFSCPDISLNTMAQIDALCDEARKDEKERSIKMLSPDNQNCRPVRNHEESVTEEEGNCSDASLLNVSNLQELSLLHSSTCSESGLTIIDVAANEMLLETFIAECSEQSIIAFSVATETVHGSESIGASVIKPSHTSKGIPIPMSNEQVVGVAFSWGDMDVYYVSLCEPSNCITTNKRALDLSQVGANPLVPLEKRIQAMHSIFSTPHNYFLIAYDLKKHVKYLMSACQVDITGVLCDPKVADWLLDPDMREKTLNHMVLKYLPEQPKMAEGEVGGDTTLSSLASHSPFPYLKFSAECILADMLMNSMQNLLQAENLYNTFKDIEMPVTCILAKLEINGIGFSAESCKKLRDKLQFHLSELEQEAYVTAGRSFVLTSPEDIARILFTELQLPSFQNDKQQSNAKSLGVTNRRGKKRIQHLSTSKDILEKIRPLHPLPGIILEWRRVSNTVTKMLYPLFKASVMYTYLDSNRIHPTCQIHTATGRMTVSDPNLQNIPKEYPIGLHKVSTATQQSLLNPLIPEFEVCASPFHDIDTIKTVCMRDVFIPFPNGIFLAADYSQLELRLLAHMSQDTKLCNFLNESGDAFCMIAGEWLSIDPTSVTDLQRQQTKQMCYGMVYGIGAKALGQQLGVSEDEAAQFMETFKSKYPTMRKYLTNTVKKCREKGFIVTLLGHKRFLPHINSTDIHVRAQAERQAINSTIQGSAADLVKMAMINIDIKLRSKGLLTYIPACSSQSDMSKFALPVLQLHDELLYEVHEDFTGVVAEVIRLEMENALQLSVKFPVKLKIGMSWGKLDAFNI